MNNIKKTRGVLCALLCGLLSLQAMSAQTYIRYIKPVDTDILDHIGRNYGTVVTVEDGTVVGGLHGVVAEHMSAMTDPVTVIPVGIPDRYISQGTQEELRRECGLTTEEIYGLLTGLREKNLKKD